MVNLHEDRSLASAACVDVAGYSWRVGTEKLSTLDALQSNRGAASGGGFSSVACFLWGESADRIFARSGRRGRPEARA